MSSVTVAFTKHNEMFPKKNEALFVGGGTAPASTKHVTKTMLNLVDNMSEVIPTQKLFESSKTRTPEHRDSFYNSSASRYNPHLVFEPTNIFGETSTVKGAWYDGEVKSYLPPKPPCVCKQIRHCYQERFTNKVL